MTGNCFSESTPFFLQYTSAGSEGDGEGGGGWRIEKEKVREARQRQSGRNGKEGANFHNEKVIICGVSVGFSLVSMACQLLARGHCVVPAMHTNSLTKPCPHGLPRLKNVSFTFSLFPLIFPIPSHPAPLPPPLSTPGFVSFFLSPHISLSFFLLHPRDPYGNKEEYTNEWIISTHGIPQRLWHTISANAPSHLFYSYIATSIEASPFSSRAHKHTHTLNPFHQATWMI